MRGGEYVEMDRVLVVMGLRRQVACRREMRRRVNVRERLRDKGTSCQKWRAREKRRV